jgi:dTMP kinase
VLPDPADVPADQRGIGRVFAQPSFKRLWQCLLGASLGDWIGLLAVTAYANALAGSGYGERNVAIAGVLFVRLLPALVVGPLGGYVADRLDRRTTLVTGLVLRGLLFASVPLVGTLWWLLVATLLVESVNLVWLPTKDALIPDLVPREQLEDANRVNLATSYGAALPAAALFTGLSSLAEGLDAMWGWMEGHPATLSMYVNAALLLGSAALAATLRELPRSAGSLAEDATVTGSIVAGWSYIARTPLVRSLIGGIVGAFAAGEWSSGWAASTSATWAPATPVTACCSEPSLPGSPAACGSVRECSAPLPAPACSGSRLRPRAWRWPALRYRRT